MKTEFPIKVLGSKKYLLYGPTRWAQNEYQALLSLAQLSPSFFTFLYYYPLEEINPVGKKIKR